MNNSRGHFRSGLKLFFAAAIVWTSSNATAAEAYVPFEGEKTTWHEGFDRYDFMHGRCHRGDHAYDGPGERGGELRNRRECKGRQAPLRRSRSQEGGARQSVVMARLLLEPPASNRSRAAETRFSHRLCGARPRQTGQGVGRVVQVHDGKPRPGEESGLRRDEQGRSQCVQLGWGQPRQGGLYLRDNPAVYDEDCAKIPELAKHDVPLLHVVGTEDFVLQRHTMVVERMYHQLGGSITVIMKEGVAHHPHSLMDPTPIADWIEQHMHPVEANRPAFADSTYTKTHYYSLENSLIYLKKEDTYATVRGPGYVPSYDRYDGPGTGNFHADAMSIVVPQKPAPGKPWVFHPSFLERDSAVDLALLAKGYYIVLPPISGAGAVQKEWDEVYKRMVDNGFAKKVVMEGTGAKAGESYAWAIANPDKVSVIYARNPLLRSLMSKTPPIDNLAPLAKAGVPILHDCGSLDPWLKDQTRVVEKRYKELGGKITVLVTEGEGHFPLSRKDPKPVVDFIVSHQE